MSEEDCEDCHVLSERIRNLAHWVSVGERGDILSKEQAASDILKLVQPSPTIEDLFDESESKAT